MLGPMLRYVDETSATVWVRTATPRPSPSSGPGGTWHAPDLRRPRPPLRPRRRSTDLEPGSDDAYTVRVDGVPVWPRPGMPPSRIRTLDPAREPQFAFGTCRTTGAHDSEGNGAHGVDALRTLAVALQDDPGAEWPDLLLLLGDQVYADTTPHPELEEFMAARRDLDEPPGEEIKDFDEYAELYRLAWSDDVIRWVLSTVPSAMMFDDHDIRDDWNTSWSWQKEMRATTWWQERIASGLAAYWVHQHIGNLSPAQLAEEEVWRSVAAHAASGDVRRAGPHRPARRPGGPRGRASRPRYRWSYTRALGDCALVVSTPARPASCARTAARCSTPTEMSWLDGALRGDVRHLFVGTSLPFLLPPGLHDFEAMNEVMAQGAYGRRVARGRRAPAPEHRPRALGRLQRGLRRGLRDGHGGRPRRAGRGAATRSPSSPATCTTPTSPRSPTPCGSGAPSRVVQAVCSPIRNPMPRGVRVVMSLFAQSLVRPMRFIASRSSRVPDPRLPLDGHRRPVVRQQHRPRDRGRRRACDCRGSPASSTATRPPAARAGVCRAPRPAARHGGRGSRSRVRSGFSTRAEHRGRRLALAGQGAVPGHGVVPTRPAGPAGPRPEGPP